MTTPFKAPDVVFVTKIYHPNIFRITGKVCMDLFQYVWNPMKNVRWVIESRLNLMICPDCEHALDTEISSLIKEDYKAYAATAREWMFLYAQ